MSKRTCAFCGAVFDISHSFWDEGRKMYFCGETCGKNYRNDHDQNPHRQIDALDQLRDAIIKRNELHEEYDKWRKIVIEQLGGKP